MLEQSRKIDFCNLNMRPNMTPIKYHFCLYAIIATRKPVLNAIYFRSLIPVHCKFCMGTFLTREEVRWQVNKMKTLKATNIVHSKRYINKVLMTSCIKTISGIWGRSVDSLEHTYIQPSSGLYFLYIFLVLFSVICKD